MIGYKVDIVTSVIQPHPFPEKNYFETERDLQKNVLSNKNKLQLHFSKPRACVKVFLFLTDFLFDFLSLNNIYFLVCINNFSFDYYPYIVIHYLIQLFAFQIFI